MDPGRPSYMLQIIASAEVKRIPTSEDKREDDSKASNTQSNTSINLTKHVIPLSEDDSGERQKSCAPLHMFYV